MHVFLGVENFAKIESARVCMDSYTLLVGPNNSGKTFLMQLIQGVNDKFISLIDEDVLQILKQDEDTPSGISGNEGKEYTRYAISQYNISQFAAYLNEKIDEKKEQIVEEIFGKEISIGKLYIEISLNLEENFEIVISNDAKIMEESISFFWKSQAKMPVLPSEDSKISTLTKYDTVKDDVKLLLFSIHTNGDETEIVQSYLSKIFEYHSLFLPASRTGLMLLYREFFANKVDSIMSYQMREKQFIEEKNIYGNLTQPIYQFLRFLQTYTESEQRYKDYKDEIEFFEKQLIEGHISVNKQNGFFYDSVTDNRTVPMHMASSMINEIAPIVLALTDRRLYGQLIIDEIEASLHPQKQLELVRFLNRLSNKGIRLILSTHSDTFASKINNLYILSEYVSQNKKYDIVKKLGLEKEDLMDPEKLFVYEFINQPNGQSVVKEITGDKTTGYQFDLFTDSALIFLRENALWV